MSVHQQAHKTTSTLKTVAAVAFCLMMSMAASAQLTSIFPFTVSDSNSVLVQGTDGQLYGTKDIGGLTNNLCPEFGRNTCGTIFKITTAGFETTVYQFCQKANCADGFFPMGGLVLASDGNFYGTTQRGGTDNLGTVFQLTPGGTLTTIHSFTKSEPGSPAGELVEGTDGLLYGTGGSNFGVIFSITKNGATLRKLHAFCLQTGCADGRGPLGIVQASDGNFYGTTRFGGDTSSSGTICGGCGVLYRVSASGAFKVMHAFTGLPDGAFPIGPLVQGTGGALYGTTTEGGGDANSNKQCNVVGCGTTFRLFPISGTYQQLDRFIMTINGIFPTGAIIQANDGNFYGTTQIGNGGGGNGNLFQIIPPGHLSLQAIFDLTTGEGPTTGVVQATDGNVYGTTRSGGKTNQGTVFKFEKGLASFIKSVPTSGTVGADVIILGTDLTGATEVTFNAKSAAFTLVSATEITEIVPVGATTGKIEVTIPSGTLASNVAFRVP